jgi:hypothetical protein
MRRLIELIGVGRVFERLPNGALVGATLLFTGLLALDFAIPDLVPFLDEAVLALLAAGSVQTLMDRRDRQRGRVPTGKVETPTITPPELKSLRKRAVALGAQARHLIDAGHAVAGLEGLAALPDAVGELSDRLKAHDDFLSHAEHDPWLLDQKIRRAEDRLDRARGEAATVVEGELAELRTRRLSVDERLQDREALIARLSSLSRQVDALLADLDRLDADGDGVLDELEAANLPDLDPAIAAVLEGIAHGRAAEAEVEQALEQARTAGKLGAVKAPPPKAGVH